MKVSVKRSMFANCSDFLHVQHHVIVRRSRCQVSFGHKGEHLIKKNALIALLLRNVSFMMQAPEYETKKQENCVYKLSKINGVKMQKST